MASMAKMMGIKNKKGSSCGSGKMKGSAKKEMPMKGRMMESSQYGGGSAGQQMPMRSGRIKGGM